MILVAHSLCGNLIERITLRCIATAGFIGHGVTWDGMKQMPYGRYTMNRERKVIGLDISARESLSI